jgi:hypothetical protein
VVGVVAICVKLGAGVVWYVSGGSLGTMGTVLILIPVMVIAKFTFFLAF